MSRTRPTVTAAVVALLLLALAASAASYVLALLGLSALPLQVAANSPLLWPFGRSVSALGVLLMLAQLVVLALIVALVTGLAARGTAPGRGFWAVLFSVWLAAAVGGYLTGPIAVLNLLGGYHDNGTLLFQQVLFQASRGGGWGLYYGWIGGLVAALVHHATSGRRTAPPPTAATSFPGS